MKFRPHRGSLHASMAELRKFKDRAELVAHLDAELRQFGRTVEDADVTIKHYARDDRIGWDTYIVMLRDYGVIGFTDAPC